MSVTEMQNALFVISMVLLIVGCVAAGAGYDLGYNTVKRTGIIAASIGVFILLSMLFKLYILWVLS
jgi:hypothetical protein